MATELREDIEAGATVDVHLADQLVVHAALADGGSRFRVREVTRHARTALDVARLFTTIDQDTEEDDDCTELTIRSSA
jgi:RNA 3'-terminal phosphate cyclase